ATSPRNARARAGSSSGCTSCRWRSRSRRCSGGEARPCARPRRARARSVPQIELERARGGALVEWDADELVALADLIEELGQERVERFALADRGVESARIQEVGLFEGAHRGHEGVDARVVASAEERIAHRAEVREELADEGEARDAAPLVRVGVRVARL